MKKRFQPQLASALLVIGMGAWFGVGPVNAQPPSAGMKLKVGDMAPDFTLHYFDGNDLKDVKLSDYRGKKSVVLAFYIFAFTGG